MKRVTENGKSYIIGYHTQEHRNNNFLKHPIECKSIDAWLGKGNYFWVDIEFAKYWGEDFKIKGKNGSYDIYIANLNEEKFLNATFNEEHYYYFKSWIESAISHFKKLKKSYTLKRIHDFLRDNFYEEMGITGIIFDDLPTNPYKKTNRKYSLVIHSDEKQHEFFYYNKRIQIVVFKLENINKFALHLKEQKN
ncbi:hypothetical protein [Flavobacterium macacae]|uniref:Uncharacterized protein n=1 Tax=Flavobacterium macacae TaxID=2488993 RepID=A0A3P3WCV5_9FLAO|nr:hypothetical protein [Flavobacterium macacae]RRJ91469.1 hypothetical protein EG849_08750 [Flavobacterium macacae]